MSQSRLPDLPDIPTTDEIGAPGVHISFWHGLWAPKGTPREVIAKLNAAVVDMLGDTRVRERLIDLGFAIPAREQQTAEALQTFHRAEIKKWWPIIRAANTAAW
jgi:tripartite-type tricarboxylate transporter receptor subunit TctC